MGCTNYNQIEIKTGLKGILERRVPPRKNASKASQNVFFMFLSRFLEVRGDSNEILFLVIKIVLNKTHLTWQGTIIIMLFFVAFLN